jgi:crotonobetainyl-CoA:carnitine CoA-transferase CaiB-like acyl-CoA transferase
MPRPAARFDRTPAEIRAMAPFLGADNTTILGEIGYGADEIARFENAKVVRSQVRK